MTESWYAVHCRPRKEDQAARALQAKGYRVFYPHTAEWVEQSKRKSRYMRVAYLPRYLFICFEGKAGESVFDVNNTLLQAAGGGSVVHSTAGSDGYKRPFPIPEDAMHSLFGVADHYGQVHIRAAKRKGGLAYAVGDRVMFTDRNPLFGLMAVIEAIMENGKHIRVRLEHALAGTTEMTIDERNIREVLKAS